MKIKKEVTRRVTQKNLYPGDCRLATDGSGGVRRRSSRRRSVRVRAVREGLFQSPRRSGYTTYRG